jgi:hypothetical protein
MLTDAALHSLKPKDKAYKMVDRDGLYVYVLMSGTISFRYNYSINGRQETLVPGQYGAHGIKLAEARELLMEAKKTLAGGRSPARQKASAAARRRAENSFGATRYQHCDVLPLRVPDLKRGYRLHDEA